MNMRKFLINIEGGDCTFKETQTRMLRDAIRGNNICELGMDVTCPVYDQSSYFIKNYLSGKGGYTHLNKEIICSFYMSSRLLDYYERWKKDYDAGKVIVCDRYTGSNMIHQSTDVNDDEVKDICDWNYNFEHNIYNLPKPDATILLSMHPKIVCEMIVDRRRAKNYKTECDSDILEDDVKHIYDVYRTGLIVAELYGWKVVRCFEGSTDPNVTEGLVVRSREDIHQEIYKHFLDAYQQ